MSTVTSSTNNNIGNTASSSAGSGSPAVSGATSAKEASERFLKLLVTQLQNQDPLNPVDNAQMTSQMAQISTVSGIEKLNTTVSDMTSQFMQMQVMQGASLVGKDVIVKGDQMVVADGKASGTYELAAGAKSVKVEVLSAAGNVVDTLNLPAQTAGRHDFDWPAGANFQQSDGFRFRVTGLSGNTPVTATTLVRDKVDAVNTGGSSLTLELANTGHVAYSAISAVD